jgi:hypothetical protein
MLLSNHKLLVLTGAALLGLVVMVGPSKAAPPLRPGYPGTPSVQQPSRYPGIQPFGRDPRTWSPYPITPPIGRDPRTWSPYPISPPIGSDPRSWSPYPLPYPPIGSDPRTWGPPLTPDDWMNPYGFDRFNPYDPWQGYVPYGYGR